MSNTQLHLDNVDRAEPGLTDIELRLLTQAASGMTDKEIADQVNRSYRTVQYHMRTLRKKFNLRTRFQLGFHARGLITKESGNA